MGVWSMHPCSILNIKLFDDIRIYDEQTGIVRIQHIIEKLSKTNHKKRY